MDMVFDPFDGDGGNGNDDRRPAILAPAVATRANGDVAVVYGTGDSADLESAAGGHHVWSLTERLELGDEGVLDGVTVDLNWDVSLQAGEQTTGSPLIFDETVYFPTYVHGAENVCGAGGARLWAVDFVGDDDDEDVTDDVLPKFPASTAQTRIGFVEDNPPECGADLPDGDAPDRRALYCTLGGAVIAGLEITYRPACEDDFMSWAKGGGDGNAGGGGGSKPVLVAQTGGVRSGAAGKALPKAGGQPKANKIHQELPATRNYSMPLSWGLVYE